MLPPEILDYIVDIAALQYIHHTEILSLSLACRAFVPRCRGRIFKQVDFDQHALEESGYSYPYPNASRLQAFLALLGYRNDALGPPIGEFVRQLWIKNNFSPLLFQVAAGFPGLRSLIVHTDLWEEAVRFQEAISQSPVAIKGPELHSPTLSLPLHLERLSLKLKFPASVAACANFLGRVLQLQSRALSTEEMRLLCSGHPGDTLSLEPRMVTIQKLDLYNATPLLKILLDMEHMRSILTKVQSLTVRLQESDAFEQPLRLITLICNSLESLGLAFPNSGAWPQIPKMLDLSTLSKLKHLVLDRYPREVDQPPHAMPRGIISLLSAYRNAADSASPLESVKMSLYWNQLDLGADWDEDGSWAKIQDLISGGRTWLKVFEVDVMILKPIPKGHVKRLAAEAIDKGKKILDLGDKVAGGITLPAFKKFY